MTDDELASEAEARALVESRGFTYTPDNNLECPIAGIRFGCKLPGVFAPVLGGMAKGRGFTPLAAAIAMLGCHPMAPSVVKTEREYNEDLRKALDALGCLDAQGQVIGP